MARVPFIALAAALMIGLVACDKTPEPADDNKPLVENVTTATAGSIRSLIGTQSESTCVATKQLHAAITAFLELPNADTLAVARSQWQKAHLTYAVLQVGYALADQSLPQWQDDRDPVDAHPLLPGYLDQVPGYPRSGLVYSEVPMTPAFLRNEHQSTDFYYVTLGFHPLETLLWGAQNKSDAQRSALFVPPEKAPDDQVDARTRRVELMRLIAHSLPRDIASLCSLATEQTLASALTVQTESTQSIGTALSRAVDRLINQPLNRWQTNPEGEDSNGMPVWHSPYAKTDFAEMQAQLASLQNDWLPAFLSELSTQPGLPDTLQARFAMLSDQLSTLGKSPKARSIEAISQAQDQVGQLIDMLGNRRDQSSNTDISGGPD